MSFDLFLHFFSEGKPQLVATQLVKRAFGSAFVENDRGFDLKYDAENFSNVYGDFELELIDSFMISRPSMHPEFWSSVLEVLCQEGATLVAPGVGYLVTANPSSEKHVPRDVGMPIQCVKTGNEIVELIRN
ncbi:hypothetical protein BTA51_23440 [Hahella sp. CCB-MM4]|uniref:hypothetical protein n=1 Tax=Hahella sp. (strain CCB-MM4) TaxID=1926491 RepID=UPI000B9AD844|nr:hypothetical protein [Hahella sp. CCB-MM4]OZG71058.1 hypothetical protein BTA51_23440 [Hahella sp. CCB-MM4]